MIKDRTVGVWYLLFTTPFECKAGAADSEGSHKKFLREAEIMLICRHAVLLTALNYPLNDKEKWNVNSCYTIVAAELSQYA